MVQERLLRAAVAIARVALQRDVVGRHRLGDHEGSRHHAGRRPVRVGVQPRPVDAGQPVLGQDRREEQPEGRIDGLEVDGERQIARLVDAGDLVVSLGARRDLPGEDHVIGVDGLAVRPVQAGPQLVRDVHAGTDGLGTRYRPGEVAVEVEAGIHAEQAVEEGLLDQLGARRTGQVGRREAGWKLPVADRDHAALVACRLGLVVGGGIQRRGGGGGRGCCGAGTAGRAGRDYEDQSCCAPRPPPPRCARHLPTVWGGVSG